MSGWKWTKLGYMMYGQCGPPCSSQGRRRTSNCKQRNRHHPLRDLKPHGLAFCCLNTSSLFLSESPARISFPRVFRPATKKSPTQRRLSRPIFKNTQFLIIISASSFNIFKMPPSKTVIHSYVCHPLPLPLERKLSDHRDLPGPFRLTTLHP